MDKNNLKILPKSPGIYLFKDKENNIIYVGKAKQIKTRVQSYFKTKGILDLKTKLLLEEVYSVDHIVTKNEEEALLLEAQTIQDKKPKFNLLLKSGQPFIYFLFTPFDIDKGELPTIKLVRNKKLKGIYFGPFLRKQEIRKAYEFLIRSFQLIICKKKISTGCLDYHMGICPGRCTDKFSMNDYLFRIELVKKILTGKYDDLEEDILNQIKELNKQLEFERAKTLYDFLKRLDHIIEVLKTHFCETKYATDIALISSKMSKEHVHPDFIGKRLKNFLGLEIEPKTIDCFDISHFQSRFIVGSCVRFANGIPEKNKFRRFKIKTLDTQNDYAALQEIVQRRYRDINELPDLIVIDGGKGQLNAVKNLFPQAPFVSIAKKEEILFGQNYKEGIHLDNKTKEGRLLLALRDYAHHFAISYHRKKRSKDDYLN